MNYLKDLWQKIKKYQVDILLALVVSAGASSILYLYFSSRNKK